MHTEVDALVLGPLITLTLTLILAQVDAEAIVTLTLILAQVDAEAIDDMRPLIILTLTPTLAQVDAEALADMAQLVVTARKRRESRLRSGLLPAVVDSTEAAL